MADDRREGSRRRRTRGKHVALGAGIGMIFGAALGNPGVGMVLGAAAGLSLERIRHGPGSSGG